MTDQMTRPSQLPNSSSPPPAGDGAGLPLWAEIKAWWQGLWTTAATGPDPQLPDTHWEDLQ
jgi:hypothetical protein